MQVNSQRPPPHDGADAGVRRWLLGVTLVYMAFVVYGSLVPLDFVGMPLNRAIGQFGHIRYLDLGIQSRADWVANILLFIPLTFLWSGLLNSRRSRLSRELLLWILAVCFSVAIEFTQVFFPQRTVSLNDIIAESIGAALGIAAWRASGQQITAWVSRWRLVRGATGRAEQVLFLYLALLFGYNLLPLDLILSPVALYHKWQEGRILLIPFQGHYKDLVGGLYDLLADIVIWIPPAILWVWSGHKRPAQAFAWTLGSAAILECLQLFVWSRVTDATDLLTAAIGAAVGIAIARHFAFSPKADRHSTSDFTGPLLGVLGWSFLLLAVFWYPWRFDLDPASVKPRMALLSQAPFHAYYFGSEFRAISSLFSKLAFFLPLGALLAVLREKIPSSSPMVDRLAVGYGVMLGLGIELVQILIPGKSIDLADWLITSAGVWIGYRGWRYLRGYDSARPSRPMGAKMDAHRRNSSYWSWMVLLGAFILLGGIAVQSEMVPYNVRELVGTGAKAWLGVTGLLVAVIGAFGPPMWLARRIQERPRSILLLPLGIVVHATAAYLALRLVVPLESLSDILGSSLLEWPPELERLGRFLGLFGTISLLLTGGALAATSLGRYRGGTTLLAWCVLAAVLLPLGYWVVVMQAATDNLTELMRGGGTWSSGLALAAWWFLLGAGGSALALAGSRQGVGWGGAVLLALLSLPLGWLLIWLGTEPEIYKYGKIFSALQFLLSPDRQHYVDATALTWRYATAHLLLTGLIAVSQYPLAISDLATAWFSSASSRRVNPVSAHRHSHRDLGKTMPRAHSD